MSADSQEFDPTSQWSFGYETFGNDRLPEHLLEVSANHAHAALRKSDSQNPFEWLEAAIHSGGAVELFAKYYLARINPVLLVDMKSIQNHGLLYVLGQEIPESETRNRKVMTRSPLSCFELVKLLSSNTLHRDELNTVLDVRNSAVHMGLVDRPELQRSLQSMVLLIDSLMPLTDVPRSKYWGQQLIRINKLASQEELHERIAGKLSAAKQAAKDLPAIDPQKLREALRVTSRDEGLFDSEEYPSGATYWYRQLCVACGRAGTVFCIETISEPSQTFQGDAYVSEYADGISYLCHHCGLELTQREMKQLNIGGSTTVDHRPATEEELRAFDEYVEDQYIQEQIDLARGK